MTTWTLSNKLNIKFANPYKSAPQSLPLLLPSTFNDTELWNRASLAGTGIRISTGETTDTVTVKYLTKHIIYVFYRFRIYFFSSSIQNINFFKAKHALHMYGCIKALKHKGVRTSSDFKGEPGWAMPPDFWLALVCLPVVCLISRSSSCYWHIQQINFIQQYFKR